MKSIDDYTAEALRRADEKKIKRVRARKARLAACAGLALAIGLAAALPRLLPRGKGSVEPVEGKTVELPVDRTDRFVANNAAYGYSENKKATESDRMFYSGLFAFGHGSGVCFTLIENGPVYRFRAGTADHITGRAETGFYCGACYYDGGVYMPGTKEVICGLVRTNGICRYDIETMEITSIVSAGDPVCSVALTGDKLVYVTDKVSSAEVKLCDLASGKVFRLAGIKRNEALSGSTDASIFPCTDGVAVLYGGAVWFVSYEGEAKLIAERIDAISACGNRIFAFPEIRTVYTDRTFVMYADADEAEVYSVTGEKLASFDASGYSLVWGAEGFVSYDGRLAAVRDGDLCLVDPVSGEERLLVSGGMEYALAAVVGDDLLAVSDIGAEENEMTGRAYLIHPAGGVEEAVLPTGLSAVHEEKLTFESIREAQEELMYEPVDVPINLDLVELKEISGSARVFSDCYYSVRRENNMGWVNIEGEYEGRRFTVHLEQSETAPEPLLSFGLKLGYGDPIMDPILTAAELPVKTVSSSDGDCYGDLYMENGEPAGVMLWFEPNGGGTGDIEVRILRETKDHAGQIELTSNELSYEDVMAILRH